MPLGGKWFQLVQMAFGGGMISTCRFVEMGRGMVGFLFVFFFFFARVCVFCFSFALGCWLFYSKWDPSIGFFC